MGGAPVLAGNWGGAPVLTGNWGEPLYLQVIGGEPLYLQVVEDAENDPKEHLSDTEDDGHFHLVGVSVQQLVLRHLPYL